MLKMLFFLCATIYLTLVFVGQEGGPVRYGLVPGKMAPLVYVRPDQGEANNAGLASVPAATQAATDAVVLSVATEGIADPAKVVPVVPAALTEATAAVPSLTDLSVAQPGAQSGLTLALPLVDARKTPPAPAVVNVDAVQPTVQYVTASSVNVRQGPSAETEALARLPRGEAVLVLPSDTPGWSMIRIEGDGIEGYIASRFLGGRPGDGLFSSID